MPGALSCPCVYAIYFKTMSNENNTINEFDFNLICDFFLNVKRQGPGSPEITLKASTFIDNLTEKSQIADIGCGTGGQTMVLAQHVPGHITGLDLFPGFIERFNANALKLNLRDRVKGIVGSMDNLPFLEEELDLIWSEGAIYNIGFEKGLNEWRKYLKTGGYIAVSDISWFTEERPAEIAEYATEVFPEMDTIPDKMALMLKAGYKPVATFMLPESCWLEHFFIPLMKAREKFLAKHSGNETVERMMEFQRYDAEMYGKYKDFYGYVFYIGKKI